MWEIEIPEGSKPIGYRFLLEKLRMLPFKHFRWSYVSPRWDKKILHFNDQNLILQIYPCNHSISDNVFEHLEFALKNEGINFNILKHALLSIEAEDMTTYVESKPTGKYARILWYLYETFRNVTLNIADLNQGGYVNLIDPEEYYVAQSNKSSRHRVVINLLGNINLAPLVRKTQLLKQFEEKQIQHTALTLTKKYDPHLLSRAKMYLYTKETMSSWEIEREKPDQAKLTKFINLLHKADSIGALSESVFVDLHKNIVDPRFAGTSYRDFQNYVGEEPELGHMIFHYICPKPENVNDLMSNLILSLDIMERSAVDPVICAAVISFLFVFIHPFEDGNGRIHRFLIHYVLARTKFTPEGIIFPVSAAIVRDMHLYDKALETVSKPLQELITDYKVNETGELTISQDTHDFYRHLDLTPIVEYLYGCVAKTVITDFQNELNFLKNYDRIKQGCKDIVDMPDQKIDLFIRCVRQNNGKLSERKKESHFSMLTEKEIFQMEKIIHDDI